MYMYISTFLYKFKYTIRNIPHLSLNMYKYSIIYTHYDIERVNSSNTNRTSSSCHTITIIELADINITLVQEASNNYKKCVYICTSNEDNNGLVYY